MSDVERIIHMSSHFFEPEDRPLSELCKEPNALYVFVVRTGDISEITDVRGLGIMDEDYHSSKWYALSSLLKAFSDTVRTLMGETP